MEDPQFKYNVAFFELNNGLQIRKKEEYIQKKENKERKKQEDAVKAKKVQKSKCNVRENSKN